MPKEKKTIIRIDWWLWRVIAMSWVITEYAKLHPTEVITARPLVFWWNPHLKYHPLDKHNLYEEVIKGNKYIELEPYTMDEYFNDGVNWIELMAKKLWVKYSLPQLFFTENEKRKYNITGVTKPILFQPFGSGVKDATGADDTYRSLYPEQAQYIVNQLMNAGYQVFVVKSENQPQLYWVNYLTWDLRMIMCLAGKYPVLAIDSFVPHAAMAFNNKPVVIWAGTDEWRLWYKDAINLREHPLVEHVPMRMPTNEFNMLNVNQFTNQFSQKFLDDVVSYFLPKQAEWTLPTNNDKCEN